MKKLLLGFGFLLAFLFSEGQVIKNPAFESCTIPYLKITEIEFAKNHTIFRFLFESPPDYYVGGWVAVIERMCLRDEKTGKRFGLIKVDNIPYFPEKYSFTGPGQQLSFTLYFEPVDLTTKSLDIIENVEGGFNFFGVALIDIAGVEDGEAVRYIAHNGFNGCFSSPPLHCPVLRGR